MTDGVLFKIKMKGFLRKLGGHEASKEEENLIEGKGEVNNAILQKWEKIRFLSYQMHQTLASIQKSHDKHKGKEKRQQSQSSVKNEEEEDMQNEYDEWYNSPYISDSPPSSTSPFEKRCFTKQLSYHSHTVDADMEMQNHNYFHKKSLKLIKKFASYF